MKPPREKPKVFRRLVQVNRAEDEFWRRSSGERIAATWVAKGREKLDAWIAYAGYPLIVPENHPLSKASFFLGIFGGVGVNFEIPMKHLEDHPRTCKWLVTPIYKPFRPFGMGVTLLRGLTSHGY